ncbi:hypothetical protein C1646_798457 [Rhizophagus diaphanus]|nr:hypothetical protein C1646_798457 [Rhizophagus diaphanus] [Rhizophagus sp. MUCL 43196]
MASPSTKHIEIDWSTPSSSSFIRLGEQPLSQEDPYSITYDNAPPVLTTTKDILSLDIDDILAYQESDIDCDEYYEAYYEDHIRPSLSQNEVTTDIVTVYTDVETLEEVTTPEDNTPSIVTLPEDIIPSIVTLIEEDIPSLTPHTDDDTPSMVSPPLPYDEYYEDHIRPLLSNNDISTDKITVTTNENILHIVTPPTNNPPLKENTFSFLISFEKFHVTAASKAGYNKIYECQRQKSFFFEVVDQTSNTNEIHLKIYTNDYSISSSPIKYFSTSKLPNHRFQISKCLTHFFLHQRVIPRTIQNKFFNLIRKKLLERLMFLRSREQNISYRFTKTFFNFSYKRYRFSFGIYIPCDHPNKNFSLDTHNCLTPCPFVMNYNRHACIRHHHLIVKNLVNHTTTPSPARNDNSLNTKYWHSNHVYSKWKTNSTNTVYSNRLGISYHTRYVARDVSLLLPPHQSYGPMYRKRLEGFEQRYSPNPKTARRQNARFNRACRRVFKNCSSDRQRAPMNIQRDNAGRQRKFLYHSNQHINSRIWHLTYNAALFKDVPMVHRFRFPHDMNDKLFNSPEFPSVIIQRPATTHANNISTGSSADVQSTQLSEFEKDRLWKERYRSRLIDSFMGEGTSLTANFDEFIETYGCSLSASDAHILELSPAIIARISRKLKAKNDKIVLDSLRDMNTSEKHYLRRREAIDYLTEFCNTHYRKMSSYKQKIRKKKKDNKQIDSMLTAIDRYTTNPYDYFKQDKPPRAPMRLVILLNKFIEVPDNLQNTSDDTRCLEMRPNKRRLRTNHYDITSGSHFMATKKICPSDWKTSTDHSSDNNILLHLFSNW